jgi:MinD-like ATPase involved in chromosome partitioning or flagellar assembly
VSPALWSPARRVVVASGQRGAGSSTAAALLAFALAEGDRRILLLDGAGDGDLAELLRAPRGAAAWPVGGGVTLGDPRAEMSRAAWEMTVTDAGWEWDAVADACAGGADLLLAVAAPDRAALAGCYALVKGVAAAFPALPVQVVLNRHRAGSRGGDEELRGAVQRFLGWRMGQPWLLPEDACLAAGTRGGMPLADAVEGSEMAAAVDEIATMILDAGRGAPTRPLTNDTNARV